MKSLRINSCTNKNLKTGSQLGGSLSKESKFIDLALKLHTNLLFHHHRICKELMSKELRCHGEQSEIVQRPVLVSQSVLHA